jgi:hypothetical protein
VSVARRDGRQVRVAVNSVPLKNAEGEMIGTFGFAQVLEELEPPSESAPLLSPRERETLTLLAAGYSTAQMAQQMASPRRPCATTSRDCFDREGSRRWSDLARPTMQSA